MVCPLWAAVLGSGTRVDADNRKTTNPLTGEPDAGDPPVRFGGRGKAQTLVPTPIAKGVPATLPSPQTAKSSRYFPETNHYFPQSRRLLPKVAVTFGKVIAHGRQVTVHGRSVAVHLRKVTAHGRSAAVHLRKVTATFRKVTVTFCLGSVDFASFSAKNAVFAKISGFCPHWGRFSTGCLPEAGIL